MAWAAAAAAAMEIGDDLSLRRAGEARSEVKSIV